MNPQRIAIAIAAATAAAASPVAIPAAWGMEETLLPPAPPRRAIPESFYVERGRPRKGYRPPRRSWYLNGAKIQPAGD